MRTLTSSEEKELVQSFQEGNNHAFDILVNQHKDKIFTSILLLVNDRFLAEDLFQDALIKIIDTLRAMHYKNEGKFLPWAQRFAYNVCMDHYRKAKVRACINTRQHEEKSALLNLSVDNEDWSITSESYTGLTGIVNMLPYEQREVVVLRHYAGLSFKEIAALTNCSINTALGRMHYALFNIRRKMKRNDTHFPAKRKTLSLQ
jgi:RNA polymerase sigma-70 factor (ECF subfamily)